LDNSKKIIKKFRFLYNCDTNKKLSEKLGISYNTLNTWIKRNSIPFDIIAYVSQKFNISLNWLFLNIGDIYLKQNPNPKVVIKNGKQIVGLVEKEGIGFQETKREIKNEYLDSFNKLYRDTTDNNLEEFFKIQFKKFECIIEEEIYNNKKV